MRIKHMSYVNHILSISSTCKPTNQRDYSLQLVICMQIQGTRLAEVLLFLNNQTDGMYKKLTLTHVINGYFKFKSVVTMPIV